MRVLRVIFSKHHPISVLGGQQIVMGLLYRISDAKLGQILDSCPRKSQNCQTLYGFQTLTLNILVRNKKKLKRKKLVMAPEYLIRSLVQNVARQSFWDWSRWNYLFFYKMSQNTLLKLFLIFLLSFMRWWVDLDLLFKKIV